MSAGRYSGVGRADRWGGTGDITAGACVDRHGDHDGERSGCMAKCPAERRATFMDECMLPPLDEVEQPPLILRQDDAFRGALCRVPFWSDGQVQPDAR
jgi:hypothetical protein